MRKIILSIILSGVTLVALAQDQMLMGISNTPQTMMHNPAFMPEQGSFLSLPLLGDMSLSTNILNVNNIVDKDRYGDYVVNSAGLVKEMKNNDFIFQGADMNLIHFGVAFGNGRSGIKKRHMITANVRVREVVAVNSLYEFLEFSIGNPKVGHNYRQDLNATLSSWIETGISYSIKLNKNINVGVRGKYYIGAINYSSENTGVDLKYNDQNQTYSFSNARWNIRNSGMDDISDISNNRGIGFDLGASYMSDNKRIKGYVSVSDIGGSIKWKSGTQQSVGSGKSGMITGIAGMHDRPLVDIFDDIDFELDGGGTIDFEGEPSNPYSTIIPMMITLGGSYYVDTELRHNVSMNYMNVKYAEDLASSKLSATYAYTPKSDVVKLIATVSTSNNIPFGLGAGIVVGGIKNKTQFILLADNLLSTFKCNYRLGVNFYFNRDIHTHTYR